MKRFAMMMTMTEMCMPMGMDVRSDLLSVDGQGA